MSAVKLTGGHSENVLCVATTCNGQILSGGEDGEFCCWAPDGRLIHKKKVAEDADVTSICCSRLQPEQFFISCGSQIHIMDLRNLDEKINSFDFNEDEVNHIALNEKETFLAAGDDSGHIKIIDLHDKKVYKTLRKHTNICSSVTFRPRRPWDLFSAGLDCQLIVWDFSRSRSTCMIDMRGIGSPDEDSESGSYLINPPFVHAISLTKDGSILACALENAEIVLFRSAQRQIAYQTTLRGHTQGVSQVHFPAFADKMLISGANDGLVNIWDLSGVEQQNHAGMNGHSNGNGAQAEAAAAAMPDDGSASPKRTIEHGAKINWISSGSYWENKYFVIADNTPTLTVYPWQDS